MRGSIILRRAARLSPQGVFWGDARSARRDAGIGRAGDSVFDRRHRAGTVHRHCARVPRALWRRKPGCPSYADATPPSGFSPGTMDAPGVVEEMLREFELLVAPRGGHFAPPAEYPAPNPCAACAERTRRGVVDRSAGANRARRAVGTSGAGENSASGCGRSIREGWCRGTRASDGCGWDGAACAAPWLRSGGCARA